MPDFKIVISDPEAPKQERLVKVKIKGDPEIEYTDRVKEQYELPIIKVNEKTAKEINAVHGVATIRMIKPGTTEKVKITGRLVIDNNVPDGEARVNAELLVNSVGVDEVDGVIFRARAWQIRISDERAKAFIGLKIGDRIDGSIVGLKNVKLEIRGGSDNSGFPMRPDIPGGVKKRVLLSGSPGFHPREKGERRRKTVRGNTITEDIVQINTKIVYE
ncbi:MAG: 30S ribosomal protein S6e [Thermoprotei archaeon]